MTMRGSSSSHGATQCSTEVRGFKRYLSPSGPDGQSVRAAAGTGTRVLWLAATSGSGTISTSDSSGHDCEDEAEQSEVRKCVCMQTGLSEPQLQCGADSACSMAVAFLS